MLGLYYRIGIHTAPPGTLFYFIHVRLRNRLSRRLRHYVTGELYSRGRFGGTPYYDIARIRRTRPVDGLALVFFIGLGDYLFATPAIEALRMAYPGLPIYAYVSSNTDQVNSPLVAVMARTNRHIDAVFTYRGRPGRHWTEYDFRDCLQGIPENFIILPMIYSTNPDAFHRVTSLYESFQLPVRLPVPLPVLEPSTLSAAATAILAEIGARLLRPSAGPIVCCHFGTRSSNYLYPHRDAVVRGLLRSGYGVVTLSEIGFEDPALVAIDVSTIAPNDTIGLLRALKQRGLDVYCISVNSVMWPLSSGLKIYNLGLHIFEDRSVHQYVYPNIFILTQYHYPRLSPSRVFLAPEGAFKQRGVDSGIAVTDFAPELVLRCFDQMVNMASGTVQI